jgi:hypothetical protein
VLTSELLPLIVNVQLDTTIMDITLNVIYVNLSVLPVLMDTDVPSVKTTETIYLQFAHVILDSLKLVKIITNVSHVLHNV